MPKVEAAALFTVVNSAVAFQRGDTFLYIDAGGGGTTDLARLQTTSMNEKFLSLQQIASVKDAVLNATLIDRAFTALVARRLAAFPDPDIQVQI